jgi:hypothetical protein
MELENFAGQKIYPAGSLPFSKNSHPRQGWLSLVKWILVELSKPSPQKPHGSIHEKGTKFLGLLNSTKIYGMNYLLIHSFSEHY